MLETNRLILRGHRRQDIDDCIRLWSDPAVTLHIGGRAFSSEEVWTRLLRYVGHWALLGFGYWLVTEKVSGAFVGEVGFGDFRRDISPSLCGIPEAGWVVSPEARGRGYTVEAMHAAHQWLERTLGVRRTVCMIDHDNTVSQHVASKCGYEEWTQTTYHGRRVLLFQRAIAGV